MGIAESKMSRICHKCMAQIDTQICPHCGDDGEQPQNPPMLALGTMLKKRYRVGRCTRTAGDSYTYAAMDTVKNEAVSVTEFFPSNAVYRLEDGLNIQAKPDKADYCAELVEDFLDLVRKLQKVSQETDLVDILDYFEENCTAYYVCRKFESMPLVEVVSELRKSTGKLWDKLSPIFDGFLSELEILHHLGLVHRGIDDRSLLLCTDGTVKLDAFSIASARINGKGLRAAISPQFAAPEQFCGTPYPDRTADIYAVCGVMFFCATGRVFDREKMSMPEVFFGEDVPAHVINAIVKGLSADPEHRFATVGELRAALYGKNAANGGTVAGGETKSMKKGFIWGIFAASAIVLLGIVVAGLYFIFDINIFRISDELTSSTTSRQVVSLPTESTGETVVADVPLLIGLKYDTVEELYGDSDKFTLVTKMSDFNDSYPRDYVMAQTPDAGTPSPGQTTITLTISRGPEYVVMPGVIGLGLSEAYEKLTQLGFSVYLVEVDAATPLPTVSPDAERKAGVVLDCPNAQGSIVRAESTIALYGILDEYATGTFSTTVGADGTVTGTLTPAPKTIRGNVTERANADGSVTYLLEGETVEIPAVTSYTYDAFGHIIGSSQQPGTVPSGGTLSEVTDYFGRTVYYFTYNAIPLQGTVTKTVAADGSVVYIQQLPPKAVSVVAVEQEHPDGSVTVVYEPAPGTQGGAEIPRATVSPVVNADGTVEYQITPIR